METVESWLKSVIIPIFKRYDISRAVLFGSVAKGTATKKSDLDFLVDSRLRGLKFVGFTEAIRQ
ncbi:MAG TPA: nucleotidyltransferase domain-containing protein, partial [Candidatus Eisenbergiella stercorigallinarum]|nr:nucleotidyltransferase domain-containing protein [Candidatus Eisenbergiella stercorigallinarum]